MVEKVGGALRLAAVDPAAARAGLTPGLTLADARARTPSLRTVVHRPEADAILLRQVMEDFARFTPMMAEDAPHGLMLDVTGCAHLFGGEACLVGAAHQRARRIGLTVKSALASTPQAARALARFRDGGLYAAGEDRHADLDWVPVIDDLQTLAVDLAQPSWFDAARTMDNVLRAYLHNRSIWDDFGSAARLIQPAIEAAFVRERGLLAHLDQWIFHHGNQAMDVSNATQLRANIRDRIREAPPGKPRRAVSGQTPFSTPSRPM